MKPPLPLLTSLAVCALAAVAHAAAPPPTYIALGDSYAYGFTTPANLDTALTTGNTASLTGYQGYVAPFSQYLGITQQNTFNLALPGETVSSFYTGEIFTPPLNLHYSAFPNGISQNDLFNQTITGLGGQVSDITVQLGGEDLVDLAQTINIQPPATGSVATLTAAQQLAFSNGFSSFNTGYTGLLKTLKMHSPNVYAIGYSDPFTVLDSGAYPTQDPFYGLGSVLLPQLNANIAADAQAAGVKFVGIESAFAGHETTLTEDTTYLFPGFPNDHPNAAGYQVIAQQIEKQTAVPEASPWTLLAASLPLLGLALKRRIRKNI